MVPSFKGKSFTLRLFSTEISRDKLPESIKSAIQKDIRDAVIRICTEKEPKESTIIQNNQTEISIGKSHESGLVLIISAQKTWTTTKRYTTPKSPGKEKTQLNPKARYEITVRVKPEARRKRKHSETVQGSPGPSAQSADSATAETPSKKTQCQIM